MRHDGWLLLLLLLLLAVAASAAGPARVAAANGGSGVRSVGWPFAHSKLLTVLQLAQSASAAPRRLQREAGALADTPAERAANFRACSCLTAAL